MAFDKGQIVGWKLLDCGKKQVGAKVYEREFDGKKFKTCEIGVPYEFKGKDGAVRKGIEANMTFSQLAVAIDLALEMDQKFNQGKISEKLLGKLKNATGSSLDDDEVPF